MLDSCDEDDYFIHVYSSQGIEGVMNAYIEQDYDDLLINFSKKFSGRVLIFMNVKTWQGVRQGFKEIPDCSIRDIVQPFGCEEFAIYTDSYNICFIGYHHDSDGVPNKGIFRAIRPNQYHRSVDSLGASILKSKYALSTYTTSLKPIIDNVYGKSTKKKKSNNKKKG